WGRALVVSVTGPRLPSPGRPRRRPGAKVARLRARLLARAAPSASRAYRYDAAANARASDPVERPGARDRTHGRKGRVTAVAPRPVVVAPAQPAERHLRSTVAAYVALTKPRIIELLLVTTVPAMFLAAGGVPPVGLVLATLLGGSLAAASAN